MNQNAFAKLTTLLNDLEREGIAYTLAHNRDEAIMVSVAVPGERWEIEFLDDGTVEIERFVSTGQIGGEERLSAFFARYADNRTEGAESLQDVEVVPA